MSKKAESYLVDADMNKVYVHIKSEMDKTLFKKKFNLSGEVAENGGFDLYPKVVFASFRPNNGPVAKINLTATNNSVDGKSCRLDLKRINGLTYKIHVGGGIGFAILTSLIAIVLAIKDLQEFDFKILIMPLFGFLYILLIEGFAELTSSNTKRRILKILADNKVKYKKQ